MLFTIVTSSFSKIESTDQFVQLFVHVGNVGMLELEHGTVPYTIIPTCSFIIMLPGGRPALFSENPACSNTQTMRK